MNHEETKGTRVLGLRRLGAFVPFLYGGVSDLNVPFLELYWRLGLGMDCLDGSHRNPKWTDVEEIFSRVRSGGMLSLSLITDRSELPKRLSVNCDRPGFLLTLGESIEDEYRVRSYTAPGIAVGHVLIGGDYWCARMVCDDATIVTAILREFFETGDVSHDILEE